MVNGETTAAVDDAGTVEAWSGRRERGVDEGVEVGGEGNGGSVRVFEG